MSRTRHHRRKLRPYRCRCWFCCAETRQREHADRRGRLPDIAEGLAEGWIRPLDDEDIEDAAFASMLCDQPGRYAALCDLLPHGAPSGKSG